MRLPFRVAVGQRPPLVSVTESDSAPDSSVNGVTRVPVDEFWTPDLYQDHSRTRLVKILHSSRKLLTP